MNPNRTWTPRAHDDLLEIFDFIALDDRDAAGRWIAKLVERAELYGGERLPPRLPAMDRTDAGTFRMQQRPLHAGA